MNKSKLYDDHPVRLLIDESLLTRSEKLKHIKILIFSPILLNLVTPHIVRR